MYYAAIAAATTPAFILAPSMRTPATMVAGPVGAAASDGAIEPGSGAARGHEREDEQRRRERVADEDGRERPDGSGEAERDCGEERGVRAGPELDAERIERYTCERGEETGREQRGEIRKQRDPRIRLRVGAEQMHPGPNQRHDRHRRQREPRRLVRVVVALEVRLVAGRVPVRIDVERVFVRDGAYEIEARVLVPAAGLIEVRVRREQQHEQRHAAIHTAPRSPATSIAMLTTSPATVANAAPFGP